MGLAARIGWHARAAWRASRWTVAVALAGGVLLRLALRIEDAWLAVAVAATAAAVALAILAFAETRGHPGPARGPHDEAALEKAGTLDLLAFVFARAAFVLAAFALGLALGGAFGLRPAGGGQA